MAEVELVCWLIIVGLVVCILREVVRPADRGPRGTLTGTYVRCPVCRVVHLNPRRVTPFVPASEQCPHCGHTWEMGWEGDDGSDARSERDG